MFLLFLYNDQVNLLTVHTKYVTLKSLPRTLPPEYMYQETNQLFKRSFKVNPARVCITLLAVLAGGNSCKHVQIKET